MASQTAVSARGAYRQLLRATRVAFRGAFDMLNRQTAGQFGEIGLLTMPGADDVRVLIASREEARRNFDSHRRLGIDTPMRINHAIEVANLLKHNLVQGVRKSDQEDANWELRIHDDIERGDNDTIKMGGKNVTASVGRTCSSQSQS